MMDAIRVLPPGPHPGMATLGRKSEFIFSFIPSFIHSSICSLIHSFIHLFSYSFIHSFIHSFVLLCNHLSFILFLTYRLTTPPWHPRDDGWRYGASPSVSSHRPHFRESSHGRAGVVAARCESGAGSVAARRHSRPRRGGRVHLRPTQGLRRGSDGAAPRLSTRFCPRRIIFFSLFYLFHFMMTYNIRHMN